MKRITKTTILFSISIALIVFLMTFAVVCPKIVFESITEMGEPSTVLTSADCNAVILGSMDSQGEIAVGEERGAAVLQFDVDAQKVQCIKIEYDKNIKNNITFACEITKDDSFQDFPYQYAKMWKGSNTAILELEANEYTSFRIWFPQKCKLKSISLYDKQPSKELVTIKHPIWRYLMVIAITLAMFLITAFLDTRFKCSKRIYDYLKKKYLKITMFIICCGSAIALGILTEVIFRRFYGPDSAGNSFNASSCTVFCCILLCIVFFVLEYKNFAKSPEKALLLIILTAGMLIILTQPFSHNSWDIDSHYPWAVQNSFFGTAYYTKADVDIKQMTTFTVNANLIDKESMKESLNSIGEIAVEATNIEFSIAHVPAGVFMAVARLFGANFYVRFLCGEMASLIVYAVVCYFAVKKLKSGKMIVAAIALLPTNIFLASSYSYDYWVTAFSLLGVSYFISELEQPDKPISTKETIIMVGALMLAALPKLVYVILFVLPLFMRKNNMSKQDKKRYYTILAIFFILTFIVFVTKSLSTISGSGDMRGGAEVSPKGQILYILSNPFEYAKTLIKFLTSYLSIEGMRHYISFFAYLGYGRLHRIFVIIFCVTALTDKEKGNKFKGSIWIRVLAAALLIGGAAVMASALYVAFTPVGLEQINGCQPRYIIPLLAPVLLTIANPGLNLFKNKKIYNMVLLTAMTMTTMYEIINVVARCTM